MQKADSTSLFDDPDAALQSGSSEQRVAMRRRVTDLFLNEANRPSDEQVGVFHDVRVQLIERIEARTLGEINERLAPVTYTAAGFTLGLARHSDIGVARPILTHFSRPTTAALVEIASTGSQAHHLTISERGQIKTLVSHILPHRGNHAVVDGAADNFGEQISEDGFTALLKASETDDNLAEMTDSRLGRDRLNADLAKSSGPNARRLLRFWQVREISARSA